MKDLIEYIVKGIVTDSDSVVVELDETHSNDNQKIYLVHVSESDMGNLIGKSGKTINSIRTIAKVRAKKEGFYVDIKVVEPQKD